MWDPYECQLATVPTYSSRNVIYALTGDFAKIPLENVRLAEALKAEILLDIMKIISGTYQVTSAHLRYHYCA